MKKILIVFANNEFYFPFASYAALAKHLNSMESVIDNNYTSRQIEKIHSESGSIQVRKYSLTMEWSELKK